LAEGSLGGTRSRKAVKTTKQGAKSGLVNAGAGVDVCHRILCLLDGEHAGLETVDLRYRESFRYYDSDYPFEYYMVRYLFSQERELKILR
jgi:hypothetical protein